MNKCDTARKAIDAKLDELTQEAYHAGLTKGVLILEKVQVWLEPQTPPPDGWEEWCKTVRKWIDKEIVNLKEFH